MAALYQVVQSENDGVPAAVVPSAEIWGLMEYLSYQRVRVKYEPQAAFYKVSFPHVDAGTAQRLMDDWRTAQSRPVMVPAGSSS